MSGRVSRVLRAGAAVVAMSLAAGGGSPAAVANGADGLIDVPISVDVTNSNRSLVPCASEPLSRYVVSGHLTAPRSLLVPEHHPRAVTVYVHGSLAGDGPAWRLPGYEHGRLMAQPEPGRPFRHASVTFDRLGFGDSEIPNGNLTCLGNDADVLVQVVDALREGSYRFVGSGHGLDAPPRFERVAVAGHSGGGSVGRIAAYSFPDKLDALVFIDQFRLSEVDPEVSLTFAQTRGEDTDLPPFLAPCAVGGRPKSGPGLPGGGYVLFMGPIVHPHLLFNFDNSDLEVRTAHFAGAEREPCGIWDNAFQQIAADSMFMGNITVPVLYVIGGKSSIWVDDAFEHDKAALVNAASVDSQVIAQSGHMVMLEHTAPQFRQVLSGWLAARGF